MLLPVSGSRARELVALQGFDFLVFNAQHGTIEPRDCEGLVRAAEPRGPAPLVRVPSNQPSVILRFFDTGAVGVRVLLVASAEEAKAAAPSWPVSRAWCEVAQVGLRPAKNSRFGSAVGVSPDAISAFRS
jgi:4-hydroxy-2-oxoheptanedioate aldolase